MRRELEKLLKTFSRVFSSSSFSQKKEEEEEEEEVNKSKSN